MIAVKLLNSSAELNDYIYVDSYQFIPGENLTINLQIWDAQKNIRLMSGSMATLQCEFIKKDGTVLDKAAAFLDTADRSLWTVSLTQAETTLLAGMNIIVTLDELGDATEIQKALAENVLQRVNLSGDC